MFAEVLSRAVQQGFFAAALFDRDGAMFGIAGEIVEEEARPLAALAMYRVRTNDMAERLFTGEILLLPLEDCDVAVAVAKRRLFLVVKLEADLRDALPRVRELLDLVERMIPDEEIDMPPSAANGSSGSGPAELALIELGITVGRSRAKSLGCVLANLDEAPVEVELPRLAVI